VLRVRRFRCHKSNCALGIFCEAITHTYTSSVRLQEVLRQIGMALEGQAGSSPGDESGISGSRATILRLIRTTEFVREVAAKKVGIDH